MKMIDIHGAFSTSALVCNGLQVVIFYPEKNKRKKIMSENMSDGLSQNDGDKIQFMASSNHGQLGKTWEKQHCEEWHFT